MKQTEISIDKKKLLNIIIGILRDEERWCKGSFARDGLDQKCKATDKHACRFCVFGAMRHVLEDKSLSVALSLMNDIIEVNKLTSVTIWNDDPKTTHDVVMNCLLKTKEKLDGTSA